MASATMTFSVRVAWWVRPWLRCLGFFCGLMGREPDMQKVLSVVMRGLKVNVA